MSDRAHIGGLIRRAIALLFAAMLASCERPSSPGPESSLELARRALATNDPAIEQLADGRFVADVAFVRAAIEAVRYAGHGHGEHNETLPAAFFERTWQDHQASPHPARDALRPALAWLGGGRCANLESARVPDAFAPLPEVIEAWPASLKDHHRALSARLRAVFSRRFRCSPGVAIRVTFAPGEAPSSAPKLLAIERE